MKETARRIWKTSKLTQAAVLTFLAGALIFTFFSLTFVQHDPGTYSDELGFTGDNDYVTLEETPKETAPLIVRRLVKQGESVYSILEACGLDPSEIHTISRQLRGQFSARSFHPGQSYETETAHDGTLLRFSWFQNPATTIHIARENKENEFSVTRENREYETRIVNIEGKVNSSLSRSLQANGCAGLVGDMRQLFASRVDFRRDITPGTRYRILFEEKWIVDDFVNTGRILAAELILPGRTITAYRYTDARGKTGYYDEKGKSLERVSAFVTPCEYRRVSSRFGYRTHPITRKRHFHGGVDLATPSGTPVRATADGKVIYKGYKGAAGNMITLSHNAGYHSQYLHLSRFAGKVHYGSRVRQGQIIGYVGSTGRSTGPHLDFRIIHNGKPQNPMAILGTTSAKSSLARAQMADFSATVAMLKTQLKDKSILVAHAEQKKSEVML